MGTAKKHNRSIIVRLAVVGVAVYMIITLASLWSTLSDKREEYAAYQKALAIKEGEVAELKYLLEDGSQTELIEKAARERLGYEYSDAIVYIDDSGK